MRARQFSPTPSSPFKCSVSVRDTCVLSLCQSVFKLICFVFTGTELFTWWQNAAELCTKLMLASSVNNLKTACLLLGPLWLPQLDCKLSHTVLHLKVCSASAFHNIKQWWKIWENRGPSHPPHLQVCPNSGDGLEGMQLPLVPQSVKKGLEGHWIVQSTSYKTTGPWCPEMQEKLTQEMR